MQFLLKLPQKSTLITMQNGLENGAKIGVLHIFWLMSKNDITAFKWQKKLK